MKLKTLSTSILLATLPTSGVFAAALDRSGQSISAFLQPGNYFEAGISVLDPNVSGKTTANEKTGDMAGDYYFPAAALKLQVADQFSVGLLYDQPFGADAEYTKSTAFTNAQGNTAVEVDTQNLSLILGFQPTENWNIYGGAVYQTVKGNVSLRGSTYSALGGIPAYGIGGYDAKIKETDGYGWLAGVAYQIPEIALKAAVTYRSEIDHDVNIKENIPSPAQMGAIGQTGFELLLPNGYAEAETTITTPQSVNLDLQTGIMENTVAFANVRWVNWKDFAIRPNKFGQFAGVATYPAGGKGFDLVAYTDDQWSATVGLGRKFDEKWAGNVSVGWDSGAGNPVTTLGPTEGYWNVGLGLQYSPAPNYFIAGGVKYFWLGDAKAQSGADFGTNNFAAEFKDSHALAYGLKIGYKF
ncbi:OmpP1/FadL family transporter [Acinetobacter shaoyimingii]|uniref:Transporter n=1 Tax=Acinetobacter shaoyimingii TaxID=2715164 RepID=A0A6G8RY09_9GAMM|nr:outer membrane protein transport protein [Acinetobacter shaoyimingii]NHB57680.1 transporter [Acinetobacter shaoyimingii]QIO06623.1 transporter [Acinetobacter shaoyimingii]